MAVSYDKYYQQEYLFGDPYPELIEFFEQNAHKGKVLDLGCGQGRDAIAMARLGYTVTGIDNSKVGIDQMNQISKRDNLKLVGKVEDIYAFDQFEEYDIILLDSMFHFAKKDRDKEIGLIQKIVRNSKKGCFIVICIQDTGGKVKSLYLAIDFENKLKRIVDKKFKYKFEDRESGHKSETDYRLIVVKI